MKHKNEFLHCFVLFVAHCIYWFTN